jgi:hypothetical protein
MPEKHCPSGTRENDSEPSEFIYKIKNISKVMIWRVLKA